jgi:hypothetical protein
LRNDRPPPTGTRSGYRYRLGGRDAARMQKGGFASEDDARQALRD